MHLHSSRLSLRLVSIVLASSGFVAACGSSHAGTSSDGGISGTSSAELTACRALETASATRSRRCGSPKLFPFDDVHATHLAGACATSLGARGTRLEAAKVIACAAALEGAPCEEIPSECDLAPGALVDGTSCTSSVQCSSGNCARKPAESCGHCATFAKAGDPCDAWMVGLRGGCGGGAACAWTFDPAGRNVTATCAEPPSTGGGACGYEKGGCATGYYCAHGTASGDRKCALGLAAGAACIPAGGGDERQCGNGTSCVGGMCRAKSALGEACVGLGAASFLADSCDEALACDLATKTCATVTLGKSGDACDDQTLRCDHGVCDYGGDPTGKCLAFKTVGAACDASDVRDRCEGLSTCRAGTCQLDNPAACQ